MKNIIPILVSCITLAVTPASAQETPAKPTVEELRKNLITSVSEDIANNKGWDEIEVAEAKRMVELLRVVPPEKLTEREMRPLNALVSAGKLSQKTKDGYRLYIERLEAEATAAKDKFVEEISKEASQGLRLVMKSEEPEQIRKTIEEFSQFRNKILSGNVRDDRISSTKLSNVNQFMENSLKFYEARKEENWSSAANYLRYMEQSLSSSGSFVTAEEIKAFMEKSRTSIGLLSPKELEETYAKMMDELLNDANQDRISDILLQIRKLIQMTGSSSSSGYAVISSRLQRLESFGKALLQSIQRVKYGELSAFRLEQWINSDSSYGVLMKQEELQPRLKKYRIRVKNAEGQTTESRLYYDADELLAVSNDLLAELLNDANQDRIDEIIQKCRSFNSYCDSSSSSELSSISSRLTQVQYLGNYLNQSIRRLQTGATSQISIDQWLNQSSNSKPLMKRQELVDKLKAYNVKVTAVDNSTTMEPLYLDTNDVLDRIVTLADLRKELPLLTKAMQTAMNESGSSEYNRMLPVITRCAEIAQKLESGDAFVLPASNMPSNNPFIDSYRAVQTANPMPAKIAKLENAIEIAILKRFFPKEELADGQDHEAILKNLMKRFNEAKKYEAMDQLHRVSLLFKPNRMLLSQAQAQVIRDYLDGIRQEEVLDQPRMAMLLYQKAAQTNSTIIDGNVLKTRLQKLRQSHPADYEKAIEDALKYPSTATAPRELEVPAGS